MRSAALLILSALACLGQIPSRNEELARAVCQTCHLFPEPSLLDKETWQKGALFRMAPFLGVARLNMENRPDGKILQDSGLFPSSPIISRDDWLAISHYYRDHAPATAILQPPRPKIEAERRFSVHPLNYPGAKPMVTLLQIDSKKQQIFVGNAEGNSLDIVSPDSKLVSRIPLASAPTSLTARPEGLYLTLIGNVFPSDEKKGSVVLVDTNSHVTTLLDHLSRPTSAALSDLNSDGREDLVLCAFGNYLGKLSWFERNADDTFREHPLLERPGAVNIALRQKNIFALMAQAYESIHLFKRGTNGPWTDHILAEFHPAFGSTHLELADFNRDGHLDLLVANGDNGDYPSPFKAYHGIRIYLNDGHDRFTEKWFFPLNGAFKALAADFDADGDLDIAAISFFPNYLTSPEESFVYLENRGGLDFTPSSVETWPLGRWITMDVGDLDGDGDPDIVLGSFARGPVSIPIPQSLQTNWLTNGTPVIWLENRPPASTAR